MKKGKSLAYICWRDTRAIKCSPSSAFSVLSSRCACSRLINSSFRRKRMDSTWLSRHQRPSHQEPHHDPRQQVPIQVQTEHPNDDERARSERMTPHQPNKWCRKPFTCSASWIWSRSRSTWRPTGTCIRKKSSPKNMTKANSRSPWWATVSQRFEDDIP